MAEEFATDYLPSAHIGIVPEGALGDLSSLKIGGRGMPNAFVLSEEESIQVLAASIAPALVLAGPMAEGRSWTTPFWKFAKTYRRRVAALAARTTGGGNPIQTISSSDLVSRIGQLLIHRAYVIPREAVQAALEIKLSNRPRRGASRTETLRFGRLTERTDPRISPLPESVFLSTAELLVQVENEEGEDHWD